MLLLVAALLLLGTVLGTVAHVPLPVTLLAAGAIALWLAIFAARERYGRGRHTSAH
ncbi:nucleoside recognition membrane protein YjiH [Streptomyces sp. B3I7]|jgi:hypothetical protein|uniref:hypothetical protein n=1 Tax=unclassified Streptomyces TaxID=2593676 RepID=UPI002784A8CB|nr:MULTISPECIES: hypothetical protein [unclassified Streptomyces]MDQ0789346.1 nucleoside recognition membrane protein YjiH [Streptomyces sp. B3I8]MDQ0811042.1 nucleoside recognition membrane protein YjiH [Streptomyces sp. B3I7]